MPGKLRKKRINVLDGPIIKFAQIHHIHENTLSFSFFNLAFIAILLGAHIFYSEQWCAKCQVHIKGLMSDTYQKTDLLCPEVKMSKFVEKNQKNCQF
jgi:hypothetical protein